MNTNFPLTSPLAGAEIASRLVRANESLVHYVARSRNYWHRNAAMQIRFPHPDTPEFGAYIDAEELLYLRELQECGVAFPRWEDMITVGGETDLRIFLSIGRACYESLIRESPKSPDILRVLDFGIGCGRTARHFYRHLADYEIHGCDVDQPPIQYLLDNVPFIQPVLSGNSPPLPYDDGHFDAIYSISVFTHLNRDAFDVWLRELARCLIPGGLALITLHGSHALQVTRGKSDLNIMGISPEAFYKATADFDTKGFIWMPQTTTSLDIDTNQYGISYIDPVRLADLLPRTLEIVTYLVGEIGNWQDLAVLRRRED